MNLAQQMTPESIGEFKACVERVSAYVDSLDENDTAFDEAYDSFGDESSFGSYAIWLTGKLGL